MRRTLLLAAVALSLPTVLWKPRPARAAEPADHALVVSNSGFAAATTAK